MTVSYAMNQLFTFYSLFLSKQGDIATFELLSQAFHHGVITGMDVCIRKPLIATCGLDRSVRIWNYEAWWVYQEKKIGKKCNRTCIKAAPIITYHLSKIDAIKNILGDDPMGSHDAMIPSCLFVQLQSHHSRTGIKVKHNSTTPRAACNVEHNPEYMSVPAHDFFLEHNYFRFSCRYNLLFFIYYYFFNCCFRRAFSRLSVLAFLCLHFSRLCTKISSNTRLLAARDACIVVVWDWFDNGLIKPRLLITN